MRITDYGIVSCWYERDLLAKIDREIKHKQRSKTPTHNKVKSVQKLVNGCIQLNKYSRR